MWDNRLSKRNPKAPDMKCRSRSCDGVIWQWPPRDKNGAPVPAPWPRDPEPAASDWEPDESQAYDGEIPF